jgi:prevent-host-death family protein
MTDFSPERELGGPGIQGIDWSPTSRIHCMLDRKSNPSGPTTVGAYEAKTKFSELIARAETGESFVVTKNGKPVARIAPPVEFDREKARKAFEELRRLRELQGPPVSEQESQRNWEEMKRELDAEDDAWDDQWLSSSTPR